MHRAHTATTMCVPEIGHCDAPLLFHAKTGELVYRDTYHIMAHFSRYVRRNSRVVKTTIHPPVGKGVAGSEGQRDTLSAVAVVDPGGEHKLVVVVLNPSATDPVDYKLDIGSGRVATLAAPPRSIQTILVPSIA